MKSKKNSTLKKIKALDKDQYAALLKIAQTLNSAQYEDALIEEALDQMIKAIDAERGLFVKHNKESKGFDIISARNIKSENIEDLTEFSSGVLLEVLNKKKPLLHHDVQNDPKLSQFESVQIQKIKSVIGVPIFRNKKIWGVILADSTLNRREFNQENLLFLEFFSNLISLSLDKISQLEKLETEKTILLNKLQSTSQVPDMVGQSDPMRHLSSLIHKVAVTDANVLILGESGTGKELVAQAVHQLSNRKDKPFIGQFCGSIPDNLLESELFGFKRGAFTGANADKSGLLEVANEGSFFLDEIADISSALQAKLLRVIENKEIIRLGDTKIKKVDVRIIAATNKDLQKLVYEGIFREDLFYRLNVFPITLPPLRDRREDIPLLADHFYKNLKKSKIRLSAGAVKKLEGYYWPGNVRQLLNTLERAMILCDTKKISVEHIILEEDLGDSDFKGTLKDHEKLLLKKRLNKFDGNRTITAESLGVSVRWVQLKMREMGLE